MSESSVVCESGEKRELGGMSESSVVSESKKRAGGRNK